MSKNVDLQKIVSTQKQILEELENIQYGNPDESPTFGEKLSDKVVSLIGSWKFAICQLTVLLFWIVANVWLLVQNPFDPFPFILLNLVLSFQAAFATPLILMAQNRSEKRDRRRAIDAYKSIAHIEAMFEELHQSIEVVHKNGHEERKEEGK